ncbi:TPA: hypothetical protein ACWZJ8_000946 [Escherichia coli]|uniref:hypothetical protein n=1 Tax=Citrobacter freundii TaxID=546 RepID=UPI001FFE0B88|nr:hypothetical protein [Citrobacter freundii]
MSEYINFMGLDFNKIAEKKKVFSGFDEEEGGSAEGFEEEMFYFCCIMDHFFETYDNVSFPAYYKFCVSLDAYLYTLMYLDENIFINELIGFHPGRLFWHTVDTGNEMTFSVLMSFYITEWKK